MFTDRGFVLESKDELPRKFHYIWVGGDIPKEYLIAMQRLSLVAEENKFEVNLWVDNEKNFINTIRAITKDSILMPKSKKMLGIHVRNINELPDRLQKETGLFKSNRYLRKYIEFINREMIGNKNLAAASDLLRYAILYLEGGYYADTDTLFLLDKTSKLLARKSIPEMKDAPLYGFRSRITFENFLKNGYSSFTTGINGSNDLIAAMAKHPVLRNAVNFSIENCIELDDKNQFNETKKSTLDFSLDESATLMDAKRYPVSYAGNNNKYDVYGRMKLTLESTGPALLVKSITKHFATIIQIDENKAYAHNLISENKERSYYRFAGIPAHIQSHLSWIKTRKKPRSFDTNSIYDYPPLAINDNNSSSTRKMTIDQFECWSLLDAAKYGNMEEVSLLLKEKADVNQQNKEGLSALFYATRDGDMQMVKALLEAKADPSLKRLSDDVTPLMQAVMCGYSDIFQLLFEAKPEPDQSNKANTSLLLMAVNEGYLDIIKYLIDAKADLNCSRKSDGVTPLTLAARLGRVEVIDLLLQQSKLNPNQLQKNGDAALQVAVFYKQIGAIHALFKSNKIDPDIANTHSNSPLLRAIASEYADVAQALIDSKLVNINFRNPSDQWTPLLSAACVGNIGILKSLLDAKADPTMTKEGCTPFMVAIVNGHIKAAEILLDNDKTDVNYSLPSGSSALYLAGTHNHYSLVKKILEAKADLSLDNKKYPSTLEAAVEKGHIETAKLLIEHGAKVYDKDTRYPSVSNALQVCCEYEAKSSEDLQKHYKEFIHLDSTIQSLLINFRSFLPLGNTALLQIEKQLYQIYDDYINHVDIDTITKKFMPINELLEQVKNKSFNPDIYDNPALLFSLPKVKLEFLYPSLSLEKNVKSCNIL